MEDAQAGCVCMQASVCTWARWSQSSDVRSGSEGVDTLPFIYLFFGTGA
jgi:hypothetical protein